VRPTVAGVSEPELDRERILSELEKILANPLFKNSKRYPTLLRYVVERTLDGHPGDLKERTLGVDVFGREPNYDTNLDPVVRTTAAEIRKRLAQYYQDPAHESELRIDLPIGSYAAKFQAVLEKPATVVKATELVIAAPAPPIPLTWPRRRMQMAVIGAVGVLAFAAAGVRLLTPRSALDRLWSPVVESPSPVLLCVGQRPFVASSEREPQSALRPGQDVASPEITLFQLYYLGRMNMATDDVTTMGMLAGLLRAKGKAFHVRGESSTTYEDVRDGPVVLIGAFNNDWSMRLMGPRRFSFEREGDLFWIKDQQSPSDKSHSVSYATPYLQVTEDYAVISRVLDPVTERMVVLAGGLTGYGTIAAGEFLTTPAYVDQITSTVPRNWEHKNVQIVISTKVIHGKSGPPKVLLTHVW